MEKIIYFLFLLSLANICAHVSNLDEKFLTYEKTGLVKYIDIYSASIQAKEDDPHVEFVDSALDMSGISSAINNAQKDIIGKSDTHRLILDSLSTLLAYSDAKAVFRFLQVLGGRCKRAGATSLFSIRLQTSTSWTIGS